MRERIKLGVATALLLLTKVNPKSAPSMLASWSLRRPLGLLATEPPETSGQNGEPPTVCAERPDYSLRLSSGEGYVSGAVRRDEAYVEVSLPDGSRWSASLHTPEGIRTILDECRREDGSSGLYFWAPGVIVVREITTEAVDALVEDLMAEGELELAFAPVEDGESAT